MDEREIEFLKGEVEGMAMACALVFTVLVKDLDVRKRFAEFLKNALSDPPDEDIFVGRPHFRAGSMSILEKFRERITAAFPDELN